jgi:hypothetical protein
LAQAGRNTSKMVICDTDTQKFTRSAFLWAYIILYYIILYVYGKVAEILLGPF